MEIADSSPLVPGIPEDWTFESALEAKKSSDNYILGGGALVIIGVVGLIVAGAFAVIGLFSAAPLIPAAVIAITSIALIALGIGLAFKGAQRAESLDDKKRAELAIEHFKEKILEAHPSNEERQSIIQDIHSVFPEVLGFWSDSENPERVELCIDGRQLTEDNVLDLLEVAYQKKVPLSLNSLEIPLTIEESMSKEEVKNKVVSKIRGNTWSDKDYEILVRSFELSIKFLERCENNGYDDVEVKNKLLKALSVRIHPRIEGKPNDIVDYFVEFPALVYFGENGRTYSRSYLILQSQLQTRPHALNILTKDDEKVVIALKAA